MDEAARHACVERWFRSDADRVLAYLLHRTDRETAQDVLQEVFVIAYRRAEIVPDPATGWLFGTARRVLANALRGQRRRDQLVERLRCVEQVAPDGAPDDGGEPVRTTLARLSEADREVLTLSAWYELTATEAAAALGCSRSAYDVRLHRARKRFAALLTERGAVTSAASGVGALRALPAERSEDGS